MSVINEELEDEDFLSALAEAEAIALSATTKRRKTTTSATYSPPLQSDNEGAYTAVLRGSRSLNFQHQISKSLPKNVTAAITSPSSANTGGGGGGDSCFKCGQSGHWARDCHAPSAATSHGGGAVDPEKPCPCGVGACLVLTAKTDQNSGRKFFKCPLREENGGCGFFEWCDKNSGTDNMTFGRPSYSSNISSFPELTCPCGVGPCIILTAKTGKNIGQQFYRCPAGQESCGFFKWCSDNKITDGFSDGGSSFRVRATALDTSIKTPSSNGSPCFKCGKDGHWAKDCPQSSSPYPSNLGGQYASRGTCYKCGKAGHWASDCSSGGNSGTRYGQ